MSSRPPSPEPSLLEESAGRSLPCLLPRQTSLILANSQMSSDEDELSDDENQYPKKSSNSSPTPSLDLSMDMESSSDIDDRDLSLILDSAPIEVFSIELVTLEHS